MTLRRLLVVVNPCGGRKRGLNVLERVRPIFAEAGIELDIEVTQHAGHAEMIARSFDLNSWDGLCVVGGDGTVHEVADGLMQREDTVEIPLGIIPAGTGNTLAHHLQCEQPVDAARRIVAGRTQPLDVIRVTLTERIVHCVDLVGWGAVADINANAERWRILGPSRYAAAALWQIVRARRRTATLTMDGRTSDGDFLFIIACNPMYTGSGMKLAPHAELGDGRVDLVVVRKATRWEMLKLFSRVFEGTHLALKFVEYYQVRSFSIESRTHDRMNLDGEMKGHTPMSSEVLPSALKIFA